MYCVCFKRMGFCGPDCVCQKTGKEACENKTTDPKNENKFKKVKALLKGDAEAWEKENGEKGCNCAKNACKKNHCVCFKNDLICGDKCRCIGD